MHQNNLGPSTSSIGGNINTSHPPLPNDCYLQQPREEKEIKRIFAIEDGIYQVVKTAELSRPRPLAHYQVPPGLASANNQMAGVTPTVHVSFLDFPSRDDISPDVAVECSSSYDPIRREENGSPLMQNQAAENEESIICFNVGKELYMYAYRGTRTKTDLTRPIDKRVYKGTAPSFHIFNQERSPTATSQLLIGFTLGQLQIIDPLDKVSAIPSSKLYNEDRYIDKTAVTCLRFLPGNPNVFLSSHISGNLYAYDERVPAITSCGNGSSQQPQWVVQTDGSSYTTYVIKGKHPRNPVMRWRIGEGTIHQFNFSGPDAKMMATVSHDGFLRIFNYETQELLSSMKSYFGGLLTLAWSPDAKLIATGGEDDLLTVYSVVDKKVVCRGQAHKSWISQVQFDPYVVRRTRRETENTGLASSTTFEDFSKGVDRNAPSTRADSGMTKPTTTLSRTSLVSGNGLQRTDDIVYRIGSVGHDTFLCLWDITYEMLNRGNHRRHRNSTIIATSVVLDINQLAGRLEDLPEISSGNAGSLSTNNDLPQNVDAEKHVAPPQEKPPKKRRFPKKPFNLSKFTSSGSASTSASSAANNRTNTPNNVVSNVEVNTRLGSPACPGIRDVPIIEPLTCKKVSQDRLTVLEFRKDCVVTACQEGFICTWSRPSEKDDMKQECVSSTAAATPESEQKPSVSATASFGYGSEMSNGVPPSRSSSNFSNHELQLRSPNAASPSYRVAASTSAYHRPTYAWQNAN